MFPKLARVKVQRDGEKKLANGNILKNRDFVLLSETEQKDMADLKELERDGIQCLVYGQDGQFKAIYQYSEKLKAWKAEKMFLS
jgi:hypothetical protein